jgi:hypothetical protein
MWVCRILWSHIVQLHVFKHCSTKLPAFTQTVIYWTPYNFCSLFSHYALTIRTILSITHKTHTWTETKTCTMHICSVTGNIKWFHPVRHYHSVNLKQKALEYCLACGRVCKALRIWLPSAVRMLLDQGNHCCIHKYWTVLMYDVLCKPFPKFARTTLTYISNMPNHILTHWHWMLHTCNV